MILLKKTHGFPQILSGVRCVVLGVRVQCSNSYVQVISKLVPQLFGEKTKITTKVGPNHSYKSGQIIIFHQPRFP